ncbi:MAG: rhomboid family intramembrane serine protease, partial [Bacteroidales bacterium]|nr:rhomboid family intramembrane serine protease [Bacteroidales bacterium]
MNEKKRFYHSLVFPGFFLFVIWFVRFIEFGFATDLGFLGVFPRKMEGLIGILTSPLVHADIKHLFDNSIPLFFLSLAIFYFYREVAYQVFFFIYFITGILVWFFAREAYHIGASGLIYGFASFLFLSGIIKGNRNLLAISMLVVFLYGSLVWGLLPYDYKISWESHLMGAVTGLFMAIKYRKEGPEPDVEQWMNEMDEETEEPDPDEKEEGQ